MADKVTHWSPSDPKPGAAFDVDYAARKWRGKETVDAVYAQAALREIVALRQRCADLQMMLDNVHAQRKAEHPELYQMWKIVLKELV